MIWGGLHGLGLVAHKVWSETVGIRFTGRTLRIISLLITFHFVCFCWIYFRAADLETVNMMLRQIVTNFRPEIFLEFVAGYFWVVALMILGFALHFIPDSVVFDVRTRIIRMPLAAKALCLVAVIVLVIQTRSAEVQPFIYFQF